MGNSFTTTLATPSGGESALSLTRAIAKRRIYRYVGLSATGTKTTEQLDDVDDAIKSGESNFYQCAGHVWSFLRPLLPLAVVADTADYTLPADFGGFIGGKLAWSPEDHRREAVTLIPVDRLLSKRQRGALVAIATEPTYAATCPLPSDGTGGQRSQLMLFPTPTADATLTAPYYSNPYAIADDQPYPLGGQPHADTLMELMLAAAELKFNDMIGQHAAQAAKRLEASIFIDRKLSGTRSFGYNGNRSGCDSYDRHQSGTVTYTP